MRATAILLCLTPLALADLSLRSSYDLDTVRLRRREHIRQRAKLRRAHLGRRDTAPSPGARYTSQIITSQHNLCPAASQVIPQYSDAAYTNSQWDQEHSNGNNYYMVCQYTSPTANSNNDVQHANPNCYFSITGQSVNGDGTQLTDTTAPCYGLVAQTLSAAQEDSCYTTCDSSPHVAGYNLQSQSKVFIRPAEQGNANNALMCIYDNGNDPSTCYYEPRNSGGGALIEADIGSVNACPLKALMSTEIGCVYSAGAAS